MDFSLYPLKIPKTKLLSNKTHKVSSLKIGLIFNSMLLPAIMLNGINAMPKPESWCSSVYSHPERMSIKETKTKVMLVFKLNFAFEITKLTPQSTSKAKGIKIDKKKILAVNISCQLFQPKSEYLS